VTEGGTRDIAVSFADDRRSAVGEVVEACRQRGLTVLEGPDHVHEWWAHKDEGDLPDTRVRFFVPFVSDVDDFTTALLGAVRDGDEHVLPVLVGDVAVPNGLLHPHVAYLRAAEHQVDALVDALVERVEAAEAAGRGRAPIAAVVTRARAEAPAPTTPASFSRYAEQDAALRYLGAQFAAAAPGLAAHGVVGTVHIGDSRIAVRVERAGEVIYALDVQRGGIGGDETVNFVVGRHDAGSACTSGWARPVHDPATGTTALELHDLSLFGRGEPPCAYSRAELFADLWQRITAVVRSSVR
jgi:hypothetical protein